MYYKQIICIMSDKQIIFLKNQGEKKVYVSDAIELLDEHGLSGYEETLIKKLILLEFLNLEYDDIDAIEILDSIDKNNEYKLYSHLYVIFSDEEERREYVATELYHNECESIDNNYTLNDNYKKILKDHFYDNIKDDLSEVYMFDYVKFLCNGSCTVGIFEEIDTYLIYKRY